MSELGASASPHKLGCGLMTQDRAGTGIKDSGPERGLTAGLAGEGCVDTRDRFAASFRVAGVIE